MEREPAGETIRSRPIYRGGERLDKWGDGVWPGIIQLPLQCDVLKEAQLSYMVRSWLLWLQKISQLYHMLAATS